MTDDLNRELADLTVEDRLNKAGQEGYIAGRLGLPEGTTLDTKWGPVEGVTEGDTTTWTLLDHREYVRTRFPDGSTEWTLFGRVVAREAPVEIEPDPDADEGGDE
jgi:hypothetical protein